MSGCPMQMNGEQSWRNNGTDEKEKPGVTYNNYLQLDKVLTSQALSSEAHGSIIPEEHLFIVLHQTYELWFKQILYDIDVIRVRFGSAAIDGTMKIVQGLDRVVRIFKLLNEQILILETMSPLDFIEFRKNLGNASGFDSLQFRLLENKLGLTPSSRGAHSECHYKGVFRAEKDLQALSDSEKMPTLHQLVQEWLERVAENPGLPETVNSFWERYVSAVNRYVSEMRANAEEKHKEDGEEAIKTANAEIDKTKESFDSLIDEGTHRSLIEKGQLRRGAGGIHRSIDRYLHSGQMVRIKLILIPAYSGVRHLSHKAMRVAMMIYCYREHTWFAQLFQILNYLMDIDAQVAKWRCALRLFTGGAGRLSSNILKHYADNHVMLVQRMLGSKQGTGGSSGYYYLRSTLGDRHRIFMDIFNLSTWIIPRAFIAPLDSSLTMTTAAPSMQLTMLETLSIQKHSIMINQFG